MSWQGIEGHDQVVEWFRAALARDRLASALLFVGPPGVGKRTLAIKLAQTLLCQRHPPAEMNPCGQCPGCLQVAAGSHPDLLQVAKPENKRDIPISLLIGEGEKRMKEGLCHDLGLKPFMAGRKVALIDDADYLNAEGANCLLKTLEEPPPRSVMILVGTSPDRQLPTIRSRCHIVRFAPLASEIVARLLVQTELCDDPDEARRLACYSDGSLSRAAELADPDLWQFRGRLLSWLARPKPADLAFAGEVSSFVDDAGKEAPKRRARVRQLAGFAVEFYRQQLRGLHGAAAGDDPELARAVDQAIQSGAREPERIEAALHRCLETLSQVDRNANQATMLECWLDDLAQLAAGAPIASVRS